MVHGFWGKKLGMTQFFTDNKVIPATIIDVSSWFITDIKTKERDGYCSVQVGRVRSRFEQETFSEQWLKDKKKFFLFVREIPVTQLPENLVIGAQADFYNLFAVGDTIHVTGITKGCGFAGVVRRHGYAGGRASHGSMMGDRPGSIGFIGKSGKVIKGKTLPGHMGVDKVTMRNLQMVKILEDKRAVAVKGSIPGKAGSLVFVRKAE